MWINWLLSGVGASGGAAIIGAVVYAIIWYANTNSRLGYLEESNKDTRNTLKDIQMDIKEILKKLPS